MFPIEYDLIRARRDKLVHLRAIAPLSDERRQVEEASADDVSALLDILGYYGEELDKQQNRGATLHELNADLRDKVTYLAVDLRQAQSRINDLCLSLQEEWDVNAALRGTVGRLEDTIQALLGYTECGCGEDEEGHYGQCVPCHIRDEGIYP